MTTTNTPKEALAKMAGRATKDLIRDVILTGKMISRWTSSYPEAADISAAI